MWRRSTDAESKLPDPDERQPQMKAPDSKSRARSIDRSLYIVSLITSLLFSIMQPTTTTKKRTRTLTTPHQSAVLHALLAQSRFPTTAMRDQVGRSIGLSARKVQVRRHLISLGMLSLFYRFGFRINDRKREDQIPPLQRQKRHLQPITLDMLVYSVQVSQALAVAPLAKMPIKTRYRLP